MSFDPIGFALVKYESDRLQKDPDPLLLEMALGASIKRIIKTTFF
jgi:hypothetical protein